jgi:hypothetical protein
MGAVKNAMTRDGLDPAIMDLDHDKSVASQMKGDDDVDDGPPLKEDEKYQKYFKMLKMVSYTSTSIRIGCCNRTYSNNRFTFFRGFQWVLLRTR